MMKTLAILAVVIYAVSAYESSESMSEARQDIFGDMPDLQEEGSLNTAVHALRRVIPDELRGHGESIAQHAELIQASKGKAYGHNFSRSKKAIISAINSLIEELKSGHVHDKKVLATQRTLLNKQIAKSQADGKRTVAKYRNKACPAKRLEIEANNAKKRAKKAEERHENSKVCPLGTQFQDMNIENGTPKLGTELRNKWDRARAVFVKLHNTYLAAKKKHAAAVSRYNKAMSQFRTSLNLEASNAWRTCKNARKEYMALQKEVANNVNIRKQTFIATFVIKCYVDNLTSNAGAKTCADRAKRKSTAMWNIAAGPLTPCNSKKTNIMVFGPASWKPNTKTCELKHWHESLHKERQNKERRAKERAAKEKAAKERAAKAERNAKEQAAKRERKSKELSKKERAAKSRERAAKAERKSKELKEKEQAQKAKERSDKKKEKAAKAAKREKDAKAREKKAKADERRAKELNNKEKSQKEKNAKRERRSKELATKERSQKERNAKAREQEAKRVQRERAQKEAAAKKRAEKNKKEQVVKERAQKEKKQKEVNQKQQERAHKRRVAIERQGKESSHKKERAGKAERTNKENHRREQAQKAQERRNKAAQRERNAKVAKERNHKNTCEVTIFEHSHYRGRVEGRYRICSGHRQDVRFRQYALGGRRRGYHGSSVRLSGGCRQVQLWDEDACRYGYGDNQNIHHSVGGVKWDLNDDMCGMSVWSKCRL